MVACGPGGPLELLKESILNGPSRRGRIYYLEELMVC